MLAGKFYTIVSQQQPADNSVHFTIDWNGTHPIFEGHFLVSLLCPASA